MHNVTGNYHLHIPYVAKIAYGYNAWLDTVLVKEFSAEGLLAPLK